MPTQAGTTRAVWIETFGGAEVVQVATIPVPAPTDDEVVVRVAVASINPVDWKTAEGKYPPMGADKLPFVLGRDLAGTIETVGSENAEWAVGDRVCAFIGTDRGAQSERVVVKTSELAKVPDGVDTDVAGAVALAAMTAWQGLFDHGGLEAGQRVLIHGGAGGVGHLAVQFARWKGATVFTTASGRDLAFVRALGADTAIDYETERFEDIATDLDLVFDTQGGETQARSFPTLRKGGMLVSTLEPDAQKAAEFGVRTVPRWHADPDAGELAQALGLIADGQVRVEIARRFPLDDIREAQRFAREGHPRGKVILDLIQ
ncbi:NADP-dependent oxidoreductase [Sphingomonas sp.]|uniref:NADP-dependent oxidoreductase n=1 Tax=Sphingomonas sp. TaxID=28214 RepID=UPI0028AEAEDF|nr:NADP-dependent oxidoreductase [Sphingomonas sp.]